MREDLDTTRLGELDQRSDEIKDLLGKAPTWVVRWGITVVFTSVVMILLGSAVISYHDMVPGRVSITTSIPPAHLEARSSGRLTNVFVRANQRVEEGEVLAVIENTARFHDVVMLSKRIDTFVLRPDLPIDSILVMFPATLQLGSIQSDYNTFITQLQNYVLYNDLSPNKREIALFDSQLKGQRKLLESQREQLNLFKEELVLSEKTYLRNKNLFEQRVISDQDYELATRSILSDRQKLQMLKAAAASTEITLVTLESSREKSEIKDIEVTRTYNQQANESIQRLKNSIAQWEYLYVVKSPIKGTVTLFDVWNTNQNVEAGKVLFTVVPNDNEFLIGKVTMPVKNSGKVTIGQPVIIKLDNYPYHEWGSIAGQVASISAVPKQGQDFYTIYIKIEGLNTSFDKQLEFRQEMQGNAEIVTEKLSVLQRIFYEFRKILER